MVRVKLRRVLRVLIVLLSLYVIHLTVLSKIRTCLRGSVQPTLLYDPNTSFIFLGGASFGEWSLLNTMLDRHPEIRCGPAIWINSFILHRRMSWNTTNEAERLKAGGVTDEMVDSAVSTFIREVVVKQGEPSPHLCINDVFSLLFINYLSRLFPQAKFLLVIRDNLTVPDSLVLKDEDKKVVGRDLEIWNFIVDFMQKECLQLGFSRCLTVYNDQIETHPRKMLEEILIFLGVHWDESVLGEMNLIDLPGKANESRADLSMFNIIREFGQVVFRDLFGGLQEGVNSNYTFY